MFGVHYTRQIGGRNRLSFFHLTYTTVANTFATVGPNSAGLGTP